MKKHFYSHLVEIEEIDVQLDGLDITPKQKEHLILLIHTNIHAVVLDTVLSHIPKEDKKMFMEILEKDDHDTVWNFLEKRSVNLQGRIKTQVKKLMEEFSQDIHEVSKK